MQETINLLHVTIDEERSQLVMADRLKDDLLNQVLGLQSQYNLRKEKVDRLETELKNLYDTRDRSLEKKPVHLSEDARSYSPHGNATMLSKGSGSIKG